MKKFLPLFIICAAITLPAASQNVGIGTSSPKGKLEIEATNDGIIIPRVALTALNSATPLTSPEVSELVYNTATAGTAPNNVTPGFYYWNGSSWVRLQSGSANITASNGLTLASNNVKLGGSLTDATTTVSVGSNTLNLTSSNGRIAIGPGASATGTYATALGNNAVVSGTEAVAIGIANTGISKNTTAGSYSLAIGSDLTTGNGSNNSPIIAIGSGYTNSTAKSIMLGVGSSTPSLTLLGGSGAVPGNVGVGTITPQRLLHLSKDNNFGHINTNTSLFRLQNANNTTCPGTVNIWDVRVGNCGQLGFITSSSNVNPNFNILKANDLTADAPGVVASINTTAPVNTFMIDAGGNVAINKAAADTKLDVDGNIRGTELQLSSSLVFKQNPTSWTPITVTGTKGGYAGFYFEDEARYLMMDAAIQGVYTGSAWQWYFNNGTLTAGTVPVTRLSGTLPVSSGGTGASSLTGYVYGNGTGAFTASTTIPGSAISSNISYGAAYLDGFVNGGYGANEIGGTSGTYIDLKENSSNDYDFRIIYNSGGATDLILRQNNNLRFFTNNTDRWRITAAGHLRPSADNTYEIGGSSLRVTQVWSVNGTLQTSDIRFKNNIEEIKYGLKEILSISPISYKWKNSTDNSVHLGFSAQELKNILPEVVLIGDDEEKRLSVKYSEIIPVLVKAIQEQQEEIVALKNQNSLLEDRGEVCQNLKAELEKLKSYIYSEAKK